jgi:hypothetical protein
MARHGICHVEWNVTDFERTTDFYGKLFGWTFQPFGEDYLLFKGPEGSIGGGFTRVAAASPGRSPVVYVEVDEVDSYLERTGQLGGGVITGKYEIPGVGWIAVLSDPDGNAVGLYSATHP